MSNVKMKYKLLKALPGVEVGREIIDEGLFVFREPTTAAERMYRFKKEEIERMPDWFENITWVYGNPIMREVVDLEIDWKEEIDKCKKSPYYYATNYLTINGEKFTTRHTEKEFNNFFKSVSKFHESEATPSFYEVDTSTWKVIHTEFHHYPNHFKTELEAKEYVLLNKPCLSVNDVASIKSKYWSNDHALNELKELSKLKNGSADR